MTEMAKRAVDELIDKAQQALEELRVAVHESIDAGAGLQSRAEQFTQDAQEQRGES